MASSSFKDAFRSFADRIRFGRPHGPSEWLAPDPKGTPRGAFDAPFSSPASPVESASVAGTPEPAGAAAAPEAAAADAASTAAVGDEVRADQPTATGQPTAPAEASPAETAAAATTAASGGAEQPAAESAAVRKTAVKPAPTRKRATKKTAATKAPATKATATKAPATKATATKATATKATATKATAKKTTARKATATKATAQQATATPSAMSEAAAKEALGGQAAAVDPAAGRTTPQPASDAARAESASTSALPVRDGEDPWTPDEIAAVRDELVTERKRLLEGIADADQQLAEMLRDAGDGAVDDQADAGSRTFEREQEISLAANATETLAQVDSALRLLEQGGYGVCENCGKAIGKLRLQAYPRATMCLACKEQEERR